MAGPKPRDTCAIRSMLHHTISCVAIKTLRTYLFIFTMRDMSFIFPQCRHLYRTFSASCRTNVCKTLRRSYRMLSLVAICLNTQIGLSLSPHSEHSTSAFFSSTIKRGCPHSERGTDTSVLPSSCLGIRLPIRVMLSSITPPPSRPAGQSSPWISAQTSAPTPRSSGASHALPRSCG